MRRGIARLVRIAIAISGVAFAPSIAAADCVRQTGLEITVDRALQPEGWCVSGAISGGQEHSVYVTLDAPGLWQLELEALPGQIGVVVLASNETGLWEGILSGDGTIASPALFLGAGDYRVVLATTESLMVYRVRLTPAAPLPAAVPAAVTDAFAGQLTATAGEIAIPWTVGAGAPGALWTVSAQSLVGGYVYLTLRDATGTTVTWANTGDEAGVTALPDIALQPGQYDIRVSGPPEGTPILLAATSEPRPPGFAAEPDELPAIAHPITIDVPATGRLNSGGASPDNDFFVLEIAEGTPTRLYDLSVIAPSDAELQLTLTDDQRTVLFERSGNRQITLRGLALGPGRHFFRVNGLLPPDVTYTLLVEEAGEAIAGAEIEPNDVATQATPLPASGPVVGAFAGTDYDYIELGVAGEMQLWDIEATGAGLFAVTLYDGGGQIIARTTVSSGDRVARLSRILLPPGRNIVRLDGTDGSWLLRSTPRGPPMPGEEIEPNDEQSRALALVPDVVNIGWLDRRADGDIYAFHLEAPHRVRLTVEGPADFPLLARISWGDTSNRIASMESIGASGDPQRFVWEGLLPTGDFLFELWAYDGTSREPYALTLELPAFYDRPVDLEPNNDAWQAHPLPAGAMAAGVLQGNDTDWFTLDPALGPGPVVVRAETLSGSIRVLVARGDPASPETLQETYFYTAGETMTVDLAAEPGLLLRIDGSAGPYVIAVGPSSPQTAPPATATLAFDATAIAAFDPLAQTIAGTLTVQSESKEQLTLEPSAWIGDERWRFVDLPGTIALPAGGRVEIPVVIEIPAEVLDGTVRVEVAFTESGAQPVVATAVVEVSAGVPPAGAHPYAPLPTAMLGGLNVAWSAFGGAIDDQAQARLIDTVVDVTGVTLYADAVVRLAGGNPVLLSGVVLDLPPGSVPSDRLAAFAIELSLDGATFERVLEGRLSPRAGEQAFVFDPPQAAVAVRLVPLSVQSGAPDRPALLAEFRVVADPGFILDPAGFDIALPVFGGHVVRQAGIPDYALTGEAAVWPANYAIGTPTERTAPPEWVLGFLDGRAAQISSVVWYPRTDVRPEEQILTVEVLASVAGPLGPFETLGIFTVDPAAPHQLQLAGDVWARALLFRAITPATGRVYLPDRIEVRETPGPSVLGEWGAFNREGPYEAQLPPTSVVVQSLPPVSTDRAAPTPLPLETLAEGQVRRGEIEHWYAIDLPEGTLGLRADFAEAMTPDVAMTLFGEDGQVMELVPDPARPGVMTINAAPGRWLLRVVQPTASVVVAWDTSFSVSGFYPSIARMIRQLGNDLDPAREEINLLPFRGDEGRFLMDNWSGNPGTIFGALHAYPLRDTSSDAESALLFAAQQLSARVGSRAVVIITDAAYSGVLKNEALWRSLGQGGVRVFALHLPVDYDPIRVQAQVNLMSDWAGAAGGHVSRFASQGDSDAAFRRVSAWLARPASYAFTLTADTTPPEPGRLVVALAERGVDGAAAAGATTAPLAMAIVLDASGSMLQRLGDRRRIDVAKDVLQRLGAEILPEGLPVALRVFGHDQAGSCENALFLPLAPLDRAAFAAAVDRVQSVNMARTSIAATLRAAAGDLADATGSRLIVLITDGQETCGGDPLAEIAALRASGIDIRLNIVGFAIDDPATRALFETWATAGAGAYFDAGDQAALGAAIEGATALPYAVLDAAGAEVATGIIGGAAVELPPGRYRVRTGIGGPEQEVVIRPGEEQRIAIGGM